MADLNYAATPLAVISEHFWALMSVVKLTVNPLLEVDL